MANSQNFRDRHYPGKAVRPPFRLNMRGGGGGGGGGGQIRPPWLAAERPWRGDG